MADIYTLTQAGLKKTNDMFNRTNTELHQNIGGFDAYLETANEIKNNSEDFNVMGSEIVPFVDEFGAAIRIDGKRYGLSEWSLQQFSSKLGIPFGYSNKMLTAGKKSLFVQNFQSWINSDAYGKKFLIRTHGDNVRGVLTDKYEPTDMDYTLPLFRKGLQSTNMNLRIDKGIINPEYMNMRVISDDHIDVGGDPHFVGMQLTTSDVGRSSLKAEFFIFRERCENGMLFGKHGGIIFKKVHTNKTITDPNVFVEDFVASLENLDGLVAKTKEALLHANAHTLKDEDIKKVIESYKSFAGVGKKEVEFLQQEVTDRMNVYNNVQPTLWSVSNAFTELAQQYPAQKAEVMESFAGHVLMTKSRIA
jgi:hypothetical protein